MFEAEEDRLARLVALHEVKHLHAALTHQMQQLIKSRAVPAPAKLKALRLLMMVEAKLVVSQIELKKE